MAMVDCVASNLYFAFGLAICVACNRYLRLFGTNCAGSVRSTTQKSLVDRFAESGKTLNPSISMGITMKRTFSVWLQCGVG